MSHKNLNWFMKIALEQAEKAYKADEVPIGAIIVDAQQQVLAVAHNVKESSHNPCGHAEILAIQEATQKISNWRLTGCSVFVTLEPCPMCMSAMQQARIESLVFGAYDRKGGSISQGFNLHQNKKLNHQFRVVGGVEHYACSRLLSDFFRQKRSSYQYHAKKS